MKIESSTPIIPVLKELKFSRPSWTQKMLDGFIAEAEKQCFQNESDGTFNHIVGEVFDKASKVDNIGVTKPEAILEAIRKTEVGDNVIIHNNDGSIWCILKKVCEEHEENGK